MDHSGSGEEAEEAVEAAGLLSITRASQRLGVAEVSVRRWIAGGDLPAIRLGRRVLVDLDDLAVFVDAHRNPRKDDGPRGGEPLVEETADVARDSLSG